MIALIKNDLKQLRNISGKHILFAVLGALLYTGLGVLRAPLRLEGLSWIQWIFLLLAPLSSLIFYLMLTRIPGRFVFWFLQCTLNLGMPFLLAWISSMFFDKTRDAFYTDNFFNRFLPAWAAIWWLGMCLVYILVRAIAAAVKKYLDRDSAGARHLRDLAVMYTPQKKISSEPRDGKGKWAVMSICIVLIAIGSFAFAVALFLFNVYSNMEFEAILFTITFAEGGLALEDVIAGVEYTLLFVLISGFISLNMAKCFPNKKLVVADGEGEYTLHMTGKKRATQIAMSVLLMLGCAAFFSIQTNFLHYVKMKTDRSTIYEEYYVKPEASVLTFPEKKRNLIFVYLESMECTYASTDLGGSQEKNYMADLTELADSEDCVNFSNTENLGGASVFVPSITYTQGSTVAQTSGISLNTKIFPPNGFVEYPTMTRLEDILHDNGYNQLYLQGSKGVFSMYDRYVARYEDSVLYDRTRLVDEGYAEEGTDYIWKWGIEDRKLFSIAKELLTNISREDKPFFFTMYTMDTHSFECGHRCVLCDETIDNDYLASVDCTSRQTVEFVNWIRQQPFYENTTIILVGDHLGNKKTSLVEFDDDYKRTTYNCFIHAAKEPVQSRNRLFSSLDMFPSTLSAIGVTIQGDRLGLGTDLFSGTPTLSEVLGEEEYKKQLEQTSDYYDTVFVQQH
ncbi:MAG: LTA synthase family protein [Eubacterium sp.]|nr:LTA synthase family protein [Eubacterium sp.]